MIEIIALIIFCRMNGQLAERKGLKKINWILNTILAWIVAEFCGFVLALSMFDKTELVAIMGVSLFCAFGGYLLVRYILENKPDINSHTDNDTRQVGIDDLAPPKK